MTRPSSTTKKVLFGREKPQFPLLWPPTGFEQTYLHIYLILTKYKTVSLFKTSHVLCSAIEFKGAFVTTTCSFFLLFVHIHTNMDSAFLQIDMETCLTLVRRLTFATVFFVFEM